MCFGIKQPVLLFIQYSGNLLHYFQGFVIKCIYHRVMVTENKPVSFFPGPIHNILYGFIEIYRLKKSRCLQACSSGNQPLTGFKLHQRSVFQQRIILFQGSSITRIHIVIPSDKYSLQNPFGRPGGFFQDILQGFTCNGIFPVHTVMT